HIVISATKYFSLQLSEIRNGAAMSAGSAAFGCEVMGYQLAKSADDPTLTSVTFMLSVINRGAQSVAWKWRCKAELLSKQTVIAEASPFGLTQYSGPSKDQ